MRAGERAETREAEVIDLRGRVLSTAGGGVLHEIGALARHRDYQAQIDRASALLCKTQPDLIAGETVAIRETELPRSNWPFVVAVAASIMFWLAIGWSFTSVI